MPRVRNANESAMAAGKEAARSETEDDEKTGLEIIVHDASLRAQVHWHKPAIGLHRTFEWRSDTCFVASEGVHADKAFVH